MPKAPVHRDERTVAVDNAAGNLAFKAMTWLLVIDMGVHGMLPEWIDWNGFPIDIVAVMMGGGLTWTWQAWRNQIIPRRDIYTMAASVLLAIAVAVLAQRFLMR